MTTFLIASVTADGLIARHSHHLANWTSKEDKQFFVEITKKAGIVIMGSNTYETIGKPLKDRLNVVYSVEKNYEGVEVTQKDPAELLKELEERGYKEVAIIGGSQIYTMFMTAGLIDKLYLTVEPVVFGTGMNLFNKELDRKLQLESAKKIGENAIVLEYNIIK